MDNNDLCRFKWFSDILKLKPVVLLSFVLLILMDWLIAITSHVQYFKYRPISPT